MACEIHQPHLRTMARRAAEGSELAFGSTAGSFGVNLLQATHPATPSWA
jgi:hypothetical protein